MSSGALVKTEPVPCDFLLVAAGNMQDIQHMHPALRSRIRGYGYEVYMESTMEDNKLDTRLLEVRRSGDPEGRQDAPIRRGRRGRDNRGGEEEVREEEEDDAVFRDLGGLVRAAGDIAVEKKEGIVSKDDVIAAKTLAASIEGQVVTRAGIQQGLQRCSESRATA